MIKHVVMFKFKPEADKGKRQQVIDKLRGLPQTIEVIREFEVGEDILQSKRSFDAALISSFDDLGALETYQRHPDHVEVVLQIQEITDVITAVDYEY